MGYKRSEGLRRELSWKDTEAPLDGHAVTGELVVRREASRVSRLCHCSDEGELLECVDSLAISVERVHQVHARQCDVNDWYVCVGLV